MADKDKKGKGPGRSADRIARSTKDGRRRLTLPFRIFLYLLALIMVGALGAYLFYTWWLADPERVRAFAQRKLAVLFPEKETSVGAAEFSLFDGLDLFQVKVVDGRTGLELVRLNHAHIDFDLGRLTSPTLLIKNVTAQDLFVDMVRDTEGSWNLSPPKPSPQGGRNPFATPFTMRIQGAFVSIDDQFDGYAVSFPVNRASAMCNDDDFRLWRTSVDFGGGLLGEWRVGAEWDIAGKFLQGELTVIDIDLGKGLRTRMPPKAREIYDKFEPSGLADLAGSLDYTKDGGWDWEVEVALKECAGRYFKFPVRVTGIEGTAVFTEGGMDSLDVAGTASGGRVKIHARSDHYSREAAVDLTIEATGALMSEELLAALPPKVARIVDEFDPKGRANISSHLRRAPGPEKPYDIATVVEPVGMVATYGRFPLTVSDVRGRLTFDGGNLEVAQITGSRGDMQVFCSGGVSNMNTEPAINMRVMATAVPLTEELRTLLGAAAGEFWKSMDPSGHVDAEVTIAKPAGEPLALGVSVSLRGVAVSYDEFPYRLSNGSGEFTFAEGVCESTGGLAFEHEHSKVHIAGRADTATGEATFNITASALDVDEELMEALPEQWRKEIEALELTGVADAAATLVRESDGTMALTGIKARLERVRLRSAAAPVGIAAASASVGYEPGQVDVHGLEGWLFAENALPLLPFARLAHLARPATPISLTGGLKTLDQESVWDISFDARSLFVDGALIRRMPAELRDLLEERRANGYLDVSGSFQRHRILDYEDTVFSFSADCADVDLAAGAEFSEVFGHIAMGGGSSAERDGFVARGELASLVMDNRRMGGTRFVLEGAGRHFLLHRFETQALGGRLEGQGRYAAPPASGYCFSAGFEDVALDKILKEVFGFEKEGLSGDVNGRLDLDCLTGSSADVIGRCDAVITDGTLWEVPAVLAIFNVLNLDVPERSLFTEARFRCEFAHGRIMVRELSMSSDPATIFGKGEIGYDGTLNMTFYSHPGRIPVVSLIAGELGRQIVRARLSGSFEKPRVTLEASGPFGAIIDLIKAPFRRREK